MTFNKHTSDFAFRINYGDLSFLNENIVQYALFFFSIIILLNFNNLLKKRRIGSLNLTEVNLKSVQEIFDKHADEESKGIKVHFRLDESGILRLDKVIKIIHFFKLKKLLIYVCYLI